MELNLSLQIALNSIYMQYTVIQRFFLRITLISYFDLFSLIPREIIESWDG